MRALRLLAALSLAFLAASAAAAGDVAIIVHRDNPQAVVTMAELSRLFRLDQQRWASGDKVDVVLQVGGSDKAALILDRVYRMKAEDLKPFWLGKIYRGELTAPPRVLASDAGVKQFVAGNPRAMGYIDAVLLDASVKPLRVDGKLPGEPGYPLARTGP
jgi:ABC-type phosphate transport system substrate-binding protein